MNKLLVVDNPDLWPLAIPGAEVVAARSYLTNAEFVGRRRAHVINLCRSHGYQSVGYYVSLLATARGHRPLPSVTTMQDLRLSAVVRIVSEDVEAEVQRVLAGEQSGRVELRIYFGRNPDARRDRLSRVLFNHFPAPLLRAEFVKVDQWRLSAIRLLAAAEIPEADRPFVIERARRFLDRPRAVASAAQARFDLALLFDPDEVDAPSDERAIARFERAAEQVGLDVTRIGKEDYGRVAEFDALFIRETTYVNHHTYRFASRAEAEGLVVIDDPESIVRCTNKVYLAEAFERGGIATPRTMVVHRNNRAAVGSTLGFPCVLKRPDSSFSMGVTRVASEAELQAQLDGLFEASELVVAQAFSPSSFDWRIGVLTGEPLYACRYHMAPGHWQIQKVGPRGGRRYGKVETMALDKAPPEAVSLAVRAAALIGDGLYGVDIKELDSGFVAIEVNDNPSIEAGCEDAVLGDELYLAVMRFFAERLERRGVAGGRVRAGGRP